MDTIRTNINVGKSSNKINNNNSKIEEINLNLENMSVPSNKIDQAIFNSKIDKINQMNDSDNDDLLYRNTLGVDGKKINYTKRIIKNGEVFYYKDDELIKTIHSDGSVTFKNAQGKNIINQKKLMNLMLMN